MTAQLLNISEHTTETHKFYNVPKVKIVSQSQHTHRQRKLVTNATQRAMSTCCTDVNLFQGVSRSADVCVCEFAYVTIELYSSNNDMHRKGMRHFRLQSCDPQVLTQT